MLSFITPRSPSSFAEVKKCIIFPPRLRYVLSTGETGSAIKCHKLVWETVCWLSYILVCFLICFHMIILILYNDGGDGDDDVIIIIY